MSLMVLTDIASNHNHNEVADRQRRLGEIDVFIQGTTVYHSRRKDEYKECAVAQAWGNYNKTKPIATKQT